MSAYNSLSIAVIMCLFCPVGGVDAQTSRLEFEKVRDFTKRLYNVEYKPDFLNAMSAKDKAIFDQTTLNIVSFADINAFSDAKANKITLPAGLLFNITNVTTACAFAFLKQEYLPKLGDYIVYLLQRNEEGMAEGQSVPWVMFPTFVGCDPNETNKIWSSAKFIESNRNFQIDAFALIIAHEIGHIVMRHKPYAEIDSTISQQQEYAADEYAANLLIRTNKYQLTAGVFCAFTLFATTETRQSGDTHPTTYCRMAKLIDKEIARMEAHKSDYKQEGFDNMISLFKKWKEYNEAHCDE